MLLSVRELERREVAFDEEIFLGTNDLEGTNFHQRKQLRITGRANLLPGAREIRVRGRVRGELEGGCDRCLEVAAYPVDLEFDLFYRAPEMESDRSEAELDDTEVDIVYYGAEGLETTDILREQVLLSLPMHWVCSETCQGICPVCGGNRNSTACDCQLSGGDDRWNALRDFHPSR